MERRLRNLERHADRIEQELRAEVERVRRSFKRELVLYQPPTEALAPVRDGGRTVRVPIHRPQR